MADIKGIPPYSYQPSFSQESPKVPLRQAIDQLEQFLLSEEPHAKQKLQKIAEQIFSLSEHITDNKLLGRIDQLLKDVQNYLKDPSIGPLIITNQLRDIQSKLKR